MEPNARWSGRATQAKLETITPRRGELRPMVALLSLAMAEGQRQRSPGRKAICLHCSGKLSSPARFYCSDRCRYRAFRRRRAGVAVDAYVDQGLRGPVGLGTLTHAEQRALAADLALQVPR
jgi:hypothetical protein